MRRELTHGSLFSGIEGFGLGAAEIGFSAALLTGGTSTSISGMGRAMGLTRTPNFQKH